MSKYIYTTPEEVIFVKRNNKGDVQLEVRVSNFHANEGVEITQPIQNELPWESPQDSGININGLNLEEIRWLLEALEDAYSILEMKKEEENE